MKDDKYTPALFAKKSSDFKKNRCLDTINSVMKKIFPPIYIRSVQKLYKRRKIKTITGLLTNMPTHSYVVLNICLPLILINYIIYTLKFIEKYIKNPNGAVLFYKPMLPDLFTAFAFCICCALLIDIIDKKG